MPQHQYMTVSFMEGGTQQEYQQIMTEVENSMGSDRAEGIISRIAGQTDEGGQGFLVVSVWDSHDHWLRYRSEHLQPAFEKCGIPISRLQVRTAEVSALQTA